ncbi:aldehyde dehydrogenase (NAD+) [Rhizobium leguminosarum]
MSKYGVISEDTRLFLSRGNHGMIIDGELVPAISGMTIETFNPSTGESLGFIAAGDEADVNLAVHAARLAFQGEWSTWTPYDREALLLRAVDLFERHFEELIEIESLDMGAPIASMRRSKESHVRRMRYFAAMALNVRGETLPHGLGKNVHAMTIKAPVGVVGGIIPWNGPLGGQWWVMGAALATGCTTVLKPAEDACLSVIRMVELMREIGLPKGVVNVVTGYGATAGAALARHPDVDRIAFTGSTVTGRKIIEGSMVNIKRLQLELGGKSPDIVFADADLDKAVPGAAMGVFNNTGQVCFAGTRVLVQREIVNEFTARVGEFAKTVRVGRGLDPNSQLGPIVSQKQLDRVMSYIEIGEKEGAKLVTGGDRLRGELDNGYFVSPTVFGDVDSEMTISREEIFGPVLSIIPFDTIDDAIRIGNQTEYGLGGGVWTKNVSTAMRVVNEIYTGTMWVNCYGLLDPLVGFGGTKMSGYGSKGGLAHLDNYLYTKCVYMQI